MAPQVWRRHALSVEAQTGALSEPIGQPGHVAVALQVVGVQATERKEEGVGCTVGVDGETGGEIINMIGRQIRKQRWKQV